jgi:hypothetical protein
MPNCPLLLIAQFCQRLNRKAEIPDSDHFRNHCWRELGIGTLANDPKITNPERMSFARHTSEKSHRHYVRPGHNSDFAFQKSVSGAPMPTKKNILLQQASTMRAAKRVKGKVPKACPIPKKAVQSKPKQVLRKVARKAIPSKVPTYMKAPPTKKRSTLPKLSVVRRSLRAPKPKKPSY